MSNQKRPAVRPERVRSEAYATEEELRELGAAMRAAGVSDRTRLLFAKLASLSPPIRLAVNLRSLLSQMVRGPISNILVEGLTPVEHAGLVELDSKGLAVYLRERAHGLLNVHQRWLMMKDLRRHFREAKRAKDEFIDPAGGTNESDGH